MQSLDEFKESLEGKTLEDLRLHADGLGIKYSANAGEDTLRKRIYDHVVAARESEKTPEESPVKKVNEKMSLQQKNKQVRQEATKLVRVMVTCMNPTKKDWEGQFFTVGNNAIPTITRFVPFGREWHVENIILDQLRQKKFMLHRKRKENGREVNYQERINEFQIAVLPALTEKELKELAQDQKARGAISD